MYKRQVHGAKGAEWRVVFVLGVEEGLLPHWRALAAADEAVAERASRSDQGPGGAAAEHAVWGLEEELKLAYVAVTRAREALYLSHCRTRRRGDRVVPRLPSRFLRGLPLTPIPGPAASGRSPDASAPGHSGPAGPAPTAEGAGTPCP